MLRIISAMGYGDCLITLSLLERLGPVEREYEIVGTAVTARISALLNRPLPVVELLPDKAAFYTVKEDGPWKALQDWFSVNRSLRRLSRSGDIFAFERRDLRNRSVKPLRCVGVYAPQTHCAYNDRQTLVRELFGHAPEWTPAASPQNAVRSVVINPCARYRHKWLTPEILKNLMEIAAQRGWSVTVLDPCGSHAQFSGHARYIARPALADAAAILKSSDLYIGPDSFFIHLAYYYRVPLFGIFVPQNHDFQVPGMAQLGNCMNLDAAADRTALERTLSAFLDHAGIVSGMLPA
ncbi:MAG: glycosyltransferase family 9 protein [Stenotrophobium sp.]